MGAMVGGAISGGGAIAPGGGAIAAGSGAAFMLLPLICIDGAMLVCISGA